MQDATVSPLLPWANFYVIVGSAAAALTGLMFVVITLIAGTKVRRSSDGVAAFGTPTVVHFCAVFLVAVILSAPWPMLWNAALLLGLAGLGGVGYTGIVIRRARRQVADEIGGRYLLRYLLPHQVGQFSNGSAETHYVTPTPYAPEETVHYLALPEPDQPRSYAPVLALKRSVQNAGISCDGDRLERVLLWFAMQDAESGIDSLPLHHSVKPLIRREFGRFRELGSPGPPLLAGTDPFIAASKICTLRRFPSGPMDWVVSGMPRSWFARIPVRQLAPALRFIFFEFGGIKPAFYLHVAHPPRNRSLILQKEVRKSYYRMARSLAFQPEIKGIMCASWLHDPGAWKDAPLAWINEPYVEWGGKIVAPLGPAPVESGFLKFNPERRKRLERGELKLMTTLAMWPRKAALAWAGAHPELDEGSS